MKITNIATGFLITFSIIAMIIAIALLYNFGNEDRMRNPQTIGLYDWNSDGWDDITISNGQIQITFVRLSDDLMNPSGILNLSISEITMVYSSGGSGLYHNHLTIFPHYNLLGARWNEYSLVLDKPTFYHIGADQYFKDYFEDVT